MTALFISDLHIDEDTPAVFEAFSALIEREKRNVDAFYILGDLVEMWVGDDDDSALAVKLRSVLASAVEDCAVFVMHGNRDFLIGPRFAADTGVTLIDDPCCVDIGGRRVLLAHGDAYCTEDSAYQKLRSMFRSAAWQANILTKSLDERREFARSLRQQSKVANANKADNIMDVTHAAVVTALEEFEADMMVHGHTHRPGVHSVETARGEALRYVLGDWGRCGWRLLLDGASLDETSPCVEDRLECFNIRG